MIGVDTNVLLRYTLDDDAQHSPAATAFIDDARRLKDPILISPVALTEFVWTLGRREGFDKLRILAILDGFAGSRRVAFTNEDLMRSCIEQWRRGTADLADYLIAALNLLAGARTTVTFDATAAREPGFSPVGI